MKRFPLLLCLVAFAFISLHARADMDPRIGLGDPNCNSFHGDSLSTIGPSGSFTFSANSSGGGFFGFCNGSGSIFTTVDIKFLDPTGQFQNTNLITCESDVFNTCTKTWNDGVFDLFFSGTQTESQGDSGGIPANHLMTINLNDPSNSSSTEQCVPSSKTTCTGGWTPGTAFFGQGNGQAAIPEPASILLLSSGLLALALWGLGRRRSQAQ